MWKIKLKIHLMGDETNGNGINLTIEMERNGI